KRLIVILRGICYYLYVSSILKGVGEVLPLQELANMLDLSVNEMIRALRTIGITRSLQADTMLQDEELHIIQERQMELERTTDEGKDMSEEQAAHLHQFIVSAIQQHDLLFIDTSSLLQPKSAIF